MLNNERLRAIGQVRVFVNLKFVDFLQFCLRNPVNTKIFMIIYGAIHDNSCQKKNKTRNEVRRPQGLKAMPINIPRMAVNNIHVTQVQEKYFTEIHVDDNYCSIFAT